MAFTLAVLCSTVSLGHGLSKVWPWEVRAKRPGALVLEERSQLVEAAGSDWKQRSRKRLLIVPERKLMFCYIEKNACSQFNELMNELNGLPAEPLYFGSSAIDHFGWTEEQLIAAIDDPSWFKAVFLRDPLERLLSAFGSKCLPPDDGTMENAGSACLFYEQEAMSGRAPPFAEFVDTLANGMFMGETETARPLGLREDGTRQWKALAYDPHFVRQIDFCGGLNLSQYGFVGNFTQELNPQVTHMLELAGAANVAVVDKHFPPESSTTDLGLSARPEHKLSHADEPAVFKEFFSNMQTMLAARRLYEKDYQLLANASFAPAPRKICIAAPFGLDYEKKRILDWIAYHHLIGVDCFVLFHDGRHSNVGDDEVRVVYDKLEQSPLVTLVQAVGVNGSLKPELLQQWFASVPAEYVALLDVDEFIVIDSPSTASAATPNLHSFLEDDVKVSNKNALGVYLHRWDYGTGGFRYPQAFGLEPEFASLQERWGRVDRVTPRTSFGKTILRLDYGVTFEDINHWLTSAAAKGMLFPNGTLMCSDECEPAKPATRQPLSLNHYITGSLSECYQKARISRPDNDTISREDCEQFHPGTPAYAEMAETHGVTKDAVLLPFKTATVQRRRELFHV